MTSEQPAEAPKRSRDATATREALLDAGRVLFAERGYDRATLRDVGERAGVDPALIARYFGGKEGLYLAVFATEPQPDVTGGPEAIAASLLRRWDEHGPGPMTHAITRTELDDAVGERLRARLEERLIGPVAEELRSAGAPDPRLRAELLVAALVGVGVVRSGGGLEELSAAPREQVLELLAPALRALVDAQD